MNEIDFLPERYTRGKARTGRLWRQGLLVLVCVGALVGWWIVIDRGLNRLDRRQHTLKEQVEIAQRQQTQLNKLRDEHKVLVHQIKIQRQLAQPISHTRIMAELGRILPDSVGMTELTMALEDTSGHQLTSGQTQRGRANRRDSNGRDPDKAGRLSMEIQAIAPSGATIANLLDAFDRSRLFTSSSMRHSRTVNVDGVSGRQFRLELSIDLDRAFELPDQAHAQGTDEAAGNPDGGKSLASGS